MAMACIAAPVATSPVALSWASTRRISLSRPQRTCTAVRGGARGGITHARREERDSSADDKKIMCRRQVVSLAAGLFGLLAAEKAAQAKDIPLFGLRKQLEKAGQVVESGVKDLASKGNVGEVSSSFSKIDVGGGLSISPIVQAIGVLGAELVAVFLAAGAVKGLTKVPSK